MRRKNTLFYLNLFCSGQFACDRALYTPETLVETASDAKYKETCLGQPYTDQRGTNLLVFLSGVEVTNLTLPPYLMQSSWTDDYADVYTEPYWKEADRKPYLIHYYGYAHQMNLNWEVMDPFRELLSRKEQEEFMAEAERWNIIRRRWDAEYRGMPDTG